MQFCFSIRYKAILEGIIKTGEAELVPSLQAFIEACKFFQQLPFEVMANGFKTKTHSHT